MVRIAGFRQPMPRLAKTHHFRMTPPAIGAYGAVRQFVWILGNCRRGRTWMALRLGPGTNPTSMAGIGQPHLTALASLFGMRNAALREATQELGRRIEIAQDAVREAPYGARKLTSQLVDYMRKRWNGTFKQIISSTGRKS